MCCCALAKKDVYLYIIIRTFLTLKTERLADSFLSYGHQIGGVTLVFSRFHGLFSKKTHFYKKPTTEVPLDENHRWEAIGYQGMFTL